MANPLEEYSKALSGGLSRRQALQRIGGLLSVAVLPSQLRPRLKPGPVARRADTGASPSGVSEGGPSYRESGQPRFQHTMTPLRDGRVLIVGGMSSGPLSSAEIFDPLNNRWQDAAPMSAPRAQHAAALLPDGRVVVIGGVSRGGAVSSAEIYDPATDRWIDAPSLPMPRFQHAAATLPTGQVLVTGGYFNGALSGVEVYDPSGGGRSSF